MRLTTKEADVLAAVELRATMTVEQIRMETGYRSHTVRHALGHLRELQVIRPYPLINLNAIGYSMHQFLFSIENERKSVRGALLRAFMQAPEVLRVTEFGSEYEYGVGICARSAGEVATILQRLAGSFENFLSKRAVATQFNSTLFPRRYLSAKPVRSRPVDVSRGADVQAIDALDERILRALARSSTFTHPMLARELGIPPSTLDLRLKKLESRRVIVGYAYAVSASVFQMQSYLILVQARRLGRDILGKLRRFAESHPCVVGISECFGSWDAAIQVEAHVAEEANGISLELCELLGAAIHSVRTLPQVRELKSQPYLGIAPVVDDQSLAA